MANRRAAVTFTIKLRFEDTRERGFLPRMDGELLKFLIGAIRQFEEGRGVELVKDTYGARYAEGKAAGIIR